MASAQSGPSTPSSGPPLVEDSESSFELCEEVVLLAEILRAKGAGTILLQREQQESAGPSWRMCNTSA